MTWYVAIKSRFEGRTVTIQEARFHNEAEALQQYLSWRAFIQGAGQAHYYVTYPNLTEANS